MSDYFETEEIVKGYDRDIVRRILSYVKPYTLAAAVMIIALAVSTLGELAVPVIQQRIIDDAVLARFLVIDTSALERETAELRAETHETLRRLTARSGITVAGKLFIRQNQNTKMPGNAETELREKGVLEAENWYAFTRVPGDGADDVIQRQSGLFLTEENNAAIRTEDLYKLPVRDIGAVRLRDADLLKKTMGILLGMLVLVFGFTFIQTWTATLIGQRVMKDIRLELFKKTVGQSTAFLSRHPVGRIVTRLTGDVETINEFFTSVLIALLKDFSVMIGALITLFFLSPPLAGVTVLTLPPVLLVSVLSRVKARDAFRRQRTASAKVNSYLSERLSGVQVVQLFMKEKQSLKEFGEGNEELLHAKLGEMYVFATFRPLVEWFSIITTGIIITVGGNLVLNLSLSLGVLIAFINLISMFYAPVMDIAEKYTLLQSAMAGGERVFKLLDTNETIPDTGIRGKEGAISGHIAFENVRFSYKAGEEILKGLTFAVQPGEMAAIVGYTGAGKTTITNVLTRLWDIDSGAIRLDGIPLRDIPLPMLRRSVLPVLQEVFLFSGTVADNIRLGLSISDEEVMAAAKAVYAHDFITQLPQGYHTMLSEGASNISSGQRQLISFARVIAHNPAVVILDEATSSVDTETERLIQLGIQQVLAGRTSIVIAHRLSTIRNADRILVLAGGQIVEQGRHQELIDQNGIYAKLYKLQYEHSEQEQLS
ncbi:MAG: ABC transporter ATP-binding protein/permease [Spirochaetaceae bacterium]|jgi:ATP-binding cassette subfamily B protein|nr:ABC transporter ATP-binding protein/permease [Spirochaetaceae bacterium]